MENHFMVESSQSPTVGATQRHTRATISASIKGPSYPTRSLRFLQRKESHTKIGVRGEHGTRDAQEGTRNVKNGPLRMKMIVVGAGLGGLATAIALARKGHTVTVLEQAPALGEVGAGIQIPPNSSRLLLEWGIGSYLKDKIVEPRGISFRRWENGDVIGYTKLIPDFRDTFNAPYYVIHRAHFHEALYHLALRSGVEVKINHKVVEYDADFPSVALADGTSMSADLVIAADGVKSVARKHILGGKDKEPVKTGFAAYRATVDVAKMQQDSDISWLLEKPGLNIWIGHDRHVMTYTIASGKSFNMVLSHVDHSDPNTWRQETALNDMRAYFSGWDPQLTKIINMIENTMKWPLVSGDIVDRWVSRSGKLVMLGDAAHAMVPYMSQGAAMAVEDGAALAASLDHIFFQEDLGRALSIFEAVRMRRSSQMQEASLVNGKIWHFPDGVEQEARDAAMRPEVEGRHFIESPNQWSDPVTQTWAYGYDAVAAIDDMWQGIGIDVERENRVSGARL